MKSFQNCESLIKQCSESNLSDEEIKPHNVHNTKTKSDTAVHEQDVFDFFKPTENSLKFKNFLTPTTESNMLKYIAIKSNESKTKVVFVIFSKMIILSFLTITWLGPKDMEPRAPSIPKVKLGQTDRVCHQSQRRS